MIRTTNLRWRMVSAALMGGLGLGSAHAIDEGPITGNWWEGPEKSGRGFLLEETKTDSGNALVVNWFTYDDNGSQIWLNGAGTIESGANSVTVPLIRKEGGQFGPGFQAGQASDIDWGEATFTFQSCNQGQVDYNGLDGTGSFQIENLTRPQGSACIIAEPAANGCPSFATAGAAENSCVLSGTITTDATLSNEITWVLQGGVFVGEDNANSATLRIEPGTTILGQGASDFLYIRRGSKIIAQGTPQNPIIFTGPLEQSPGEWGGLVLAGNAPVNGCNEGVALCEQVDEALTTPYGGNNPQDDSGILKYVQIRYAGFEVRPDQELNGLTLLGVGSGTTIDFVQVHAGLDDGVEMFGGTVNLKHIVLTDIGDDSMDWGQGWRGNAQFVLIRQADNDGDHGIEADNNEDDFNSAPRSKPVLANITALGSGVAGNGALLRRGTGANIFNSVFTGFGQGCLNIDSDDTFANAGTPASLTGELTIQNSYVNCDINFVDSGDEPFLVSEWFNAQSGNVAGDSQLDGYLPAEGSPLSTSEAPAVTGDININGTFTGNWWEGPEKSGRGFILEVTETEAGNVMVVNWFTYDNNGHQIWLNGAGTIESGANSVTVPLIRKEGGQFGPDFQAGQASDIDWGEATFTFQSCDRGQVDYNGADGTGSFQIENLTRPQGTTCVIEEADFIGAFRNRSDDWTQGWTIGLN